ncbi:SH3-like domain-containing protein [Methylorubrum populi]|uniref:SH3-like domain-containing protein n=1 Tax=Methylorubrum populi TaxID=223967 RepID=UPI0023548A05|nr:SH3-like domain-containing protein [Methylorubrum populi]
MVEAIGAALITAAASTAGYSGAVIAGYAIAGVSLSTIVGTTALVGGSLLVQTLTTPDSNYGFSYNARWIWGAAKMLVDKNYVSLLELQGKIAEVRQRLGVNAERAGHATSSIGARPHVKVTTNTGNTNKTRTGKRPDYGPKAPWDGTGAIQPARFKVGDRVRVKDLPAIFYTRTQMYVRNMTGTIAALTYPDLVPADEAWDRYDAPQEQYYIVRFKQKDLWAEYPFENDTLQSEYPDMWLEAVD